MLLHWKIARMVSWGMARNRAAMGMTRNKAVRRLFV
jgi:hypothetical protein